MIGHPSLATDWGVSRNSQDVVEKWDAMTVVTSKKSTNQSLWMQLKRESMECFFEDDILYELWCLIRLPTFGQYKNVRNLDSDRYILSQDKRWIKMPISKDERSLF